METSGITETSPCSYFFRHLQPFAILQQMEDEALNWLPPRQLISQGASGNLQVLVFVIKSLGTFELLVIPSLGFF